MRIVQISDLHIFADANTTLLNLNTQDSFKAVVDAVASAPETPDMVILTGDIAQDYSEKAYLFVAKICERFSCPVFWLSGNHDSPDIMQSAFAKTQLREDKAILLGDWLLILLNSHLPEQVEGALGRAELMRLQYYLSQYPKQHTLIFLHHHPVKAGSEWLDKSCLKNPEDLFSVTDKHPQVRGIICGHVHQVFETSRQGVPIVSAPSTCIQFLPGSQLFALDTVNPGYRWLVLAPDGTFKTGIERLEKFANTADFSAKGY